ncbi:hypothetical protein HN51_067141 [Arachis hypogaea]|uniref:Knottin scorpion toxin-like domain-containing protein n=1 Tax=Arachis hypogaea TaxID=3818 RepID=A0A444ZM38_ARAHY|nr:uncharacterized protein DS421_14g473770 [Arachis hypogaea]RYR15240.1 hypothetical protein Ahy_B04g071963 [Arachis hypogaea]
MKAFTFVLIILFIFSIGIGNERLLKVSEARLCYAETEGQCNPTTNNECNRDCKRIYGDHATGHCDITRDCVCRFPC